MQFIGLARLMKYRKNESQILQVPHIRINSARRLSSRINAVFTPCLLQKAISSTAAEHKLLFSLTPTEMTGSSKKRKFSNYFLIESDSVFEHFGPKCKQRHAVYGQNTHIHAWFKGSYSVLMFLDIAQL